MWLGLPLVPGQASQWVQGMSDRIIIAALLGASIAGQYALAGQLVSIGSAVILEMSKYVLPQLTPGSPKNHDAVNSVLQKVAPNQLQLFSITAVVIGLGGSFAPIVFGEAFSHSAPIATFLAAALLFTGVGYLSDTILGITLGLTRIVGLANVIGAGVSVVANIILLPLFGIGVAVATAISTSALVTLVLWFALWKAGARVSVLLPSIAVVVVSFAAILSMGFVVLYAGSSPINFLLALVPIATVFFLQVRRRQLSNLSAAPRKDLTSEF